MAALYIDNPEVDNIHRVVCGHTIFREIVRKGNIVYIDTGAYYNEPSFEGKLTLMNVNDIFDIEITNLSNK